VRNAWPLTVARTGAHRPELVAGVERKPDDLVAPAGLEPPPELHELCLPASAMFESAVRMSIGIGNTIVELLAEPISSSVCR
jgi:hypothetical protein